jgi:hypothetical protein
MNRITQKQQLTLSKYEMSHLQYSIYVSLLKHQTTYPQLTNAQYKLFQQLFKQVQKNKEISWLKTKNV